MSRVEDGETLSNALKGEPRCLVHRDRWVLLAPTPFWEPHLAIQFTTYTLLLQV